jgi:aspartate dehydrogenase
MNIGIIGYGAIGRALAQAINEGSAGQVSLVAIKGRNEKLPFIQTGGQPIYTTSIEIFLALDLDLVVEAASQEALKLYAPLIVRRGKSLIAMSLGAFADTTFLEELNQLALQHHSQIYLPSGAIGGLDALSAAAIDELHEVTLTTIKPVKALQGVRSVIDPDLDLNTITSQICIYEGPAEEAVIRFPQNVNIAAVLSLAGIGFQKTLVKLVADPNAHYNTHLISVKGSFGEFTMEFKLHPSSTNPKTSHLTSLSVIRLLRNLTKTIKIGT